MKLKNLMKKSFFKHEEERRKRDISEWNYEELIVHET